MSAADKSNKGEEKSKGTIKNSTSAYHEGGGKGRSPFVNDKGVADF
jgi:hypothetical protein